MNITHCRGEMKRLALAILLLLFFSFEIFAQSEEFSDTSYTDNVYPLSYADSVIAADTNFFTLRYGGYFGLGANLHSSSFNQLPGIPNCCKKFESGSGFGWSLGAFAEYPITYNIFTFAKLGYNDLSGSFTVPEQTTVIIDGQSQIGEFEHRLSTNLSNIELSLLGGYRLWKELFVKAGINIGILAAQSYEQSEVLVLPADRGTFPDGTRERNNFSGSLPDANSLTAGATVGLHWTLPLNKEGSLFIMPEINYTYYFTPVVSGLDWNINSLRAGAAVKYKQPPPPPPPPPPPLAPPDPDWPEVPYPPIVRASVAVLQIDSTGKETEDIKIRIEDFISLNLRPLLNYIFFEQNSAEIPKKYIQFSPDDSLDFSNKSLENLGVLETYYHILNIVGKRLQENPKIKVTLIGHNDKTGELENKQLSKARAEAVKNYLTQVWHIPAKRIKTKARDLPKYKSDNSTPEGQAENRRVEIYSKDKSLLAPVITIDTMRVFRDYTLRFYPTIRADAGLSRWELVVTQGNKTLIKFSGTNTIPDSLDWFITQRDSSAPKRSGKIHYQLTVIDSLGQVAISPTSYVPVNQITIQKKRMSQQQDKEFEYYSLILFDFGKSKLEKDHKSVLNYVKNRIKPNSKITVTGYTDQSGDEDINRRLSFKRAKAVTKQLNLKNVDINGVGESVLLYDNSLPEGRFYCRTVKITIENQVNLNNNKKKTDK